MLVVLGLREKIFKIWFRRAEDLSLLPVML